MLTLGLVFNQTVGLYMSHIRRTTRHCNCSRQNIFCGAKEEEGQVLCKIAQPSIQSQDRRLKKFMSLARVGLLYGLCQCGATTLWCKGPFCPLLCVLLSTDTFWPSRGRCPRAGAAATNKPLEASTRLPPAPIDPREHASHRLYW